MSSTAKGVRKKSHIPIDELLGYWNDISKRPKLTVKDFILFLDTK